MNSPATGALYVHIPFCKRKCSYCDFYSLDDSAELIDDYLDCLRIEISRYQRFKPVTVYVGGGTPTCLSHAQLEKLFSVLNDNCDFKDLAEFTVEANPGTIGRRKLDILKKAGVNRLSIGVHLKMLGRIHSPREARSAVELAAGEEFENISIDIIFGIPTQTPSESKEDLKTSLGLPIKHISAYSLTYEKGTPLEKAVHSGKLSVVSQEDQRMMYLEAIRILEEAGFHQYEISNFARGDYECRHNKLYWSNKEYTGLGPSAVSYAKGRRYKNIPDVKEYIKLIRKKAGAVCESELLDPEKRARETAVMNLRMTRGIDRKSFQKATGFDIEKLFMQGMEKHADTGLLLYDGKTMKLTAEGFCVANEILSDFV